VVPNPYAAAGDTAPTNLGRLVVFGDSYSNDNNTLRPGVRSWSRRLGASASSNYARGTATAGDQAADGTANDLRTQVDRWFADGLPQGANDLAVAYLGYNDIQVTERDLAASLAAYGREVDRLLAAGVGAGDRKMLLTLVHDWSQVPRELEREAAGGTSKRSRVDIFNRGLVALANASDDLIAVDLRTVFDRIAADPGRYGFTNITTPDPEAADSTALYYDAIHFGNRGQDIVAQVFRHYLTRGWSWANSLSAGAAATARLQQDIDAGLVFRLGQDDQASPLGLRTFVVGDGEARSAALDEERTSEPSRAHFAATRLMEDDDSGVGVDYAPDRTTRIGAVISRYHGADETRTSFASSATNVESNAVSFYLRRRVAGFDIGTTATFSDDQHRRQDHDVLVDATSSAAFGGSTTSFATTASRPIRAGAGWLQPWLNLTRTTQRVAGFEQSNPYVSDLRFSGATIEDTRLGLGLAGRLDPLALGEETWLTLEGGVSYTHGLAEEGYRVRIREAATGFEQDETIEREATRVAGLRLGADLAMGRRLSFVTGYEIGQQLGGAAGHEVKARLRYLF
jgi:phospholipase/lecithinase/hemolysin